MFNIFYKSRAIKKSMTCKGWTDHSKLSLIYDLVKKTERLTGDILEIGSAWGRSTSLLCFASKKKIWSVDPHTGGRAFNETGINQNSYNEFLDNLRRLGLQERVVVLKMTTDAAFKDGAIIDKSFSFVFIDGLHTPEGVRIDFENSYPRLERGGLIVFDDYFEETVADYKDAIDSLASENGISLIMDRNSRLVYFNKEK